MMFPLVTDLADEGVPVVLTCRVLGFSKQAYFKWKANPVSQRDWDDAHLINAALDIHHDDPEFGYRFIADELERNGVKASRNRVNRLCTLARIWSVHSLKRPRHRVPGPPVHDDLVQREFTAGALNERLQNHRRDLLAMFCQVLIQPIGREGQNIRVKQERLEASEKKRIATHRHRAERVAVVAMLETDKAGTLRLVVMAPELIRHL